MTPEDHTVAIHALQNDVSEITAPIVIANNSVGDWLAIKITGKAAKTIETRVKARPFRSGCTGIW